MLLGVALLVAVVGVVFLLAGRGIGLRMPGDVSFGKGNTRVYIPIGTSILVSIVLTVLLNLFFRR